MTVGPALQEIADLWVALSPAGASANAEEQFEYLDSLDDSHELEGNAFDRCFGFTKPQRLAKADQTGATALVWWLVQARFMRANDGLTGHALGSELAAEVAQMSRAVELNQGSWAQASAVLVDDEPGEPLEIEGTGDVIATITLRILVEES